MRWTCFLLAMICFLWQEYCARRGMGPWGDIQTKLLNTVYLQELWHLLENFVNFISGLMPNYLQLIWNTFWPLRQSNVAKNGSWWQTHKGHAEKSVCHVWYSCCCMHSLVVLQGSNTDAYNGQVVHPFIHILWWYIHLRVVGHVSSWRFPAKQTISLERRWHFETSQAVTILLSAWQVYVKWRVVCALF